MAIKTRNFVFGDDFKNKSFPDFKAYMKKTHGVSAKQAKAIYDEIHGDYLPISGEADEAEQ